MKGRACTGIGIYSLKGNKDIDDWIAAVNWRSKFITRFVASLILDVNVSIVGVRDKQRLFILFR